ncbi:LruC domain-containing protein [Spongiimicrobium salis]|uniref:LruC domain-containing protein n=1 Tax=Spongiimicrobium salis TaxID=1667022 RepID=UPI00374D4437
MLKQVTLKYLTACICAMVLISCVKDNFDASATPDDNTPISEEEEVPVPELEILNLQIPQGFEFETSEIVEITITDNTPNARYDVYAYSGAAEIGSEIDIINDEGQEDTTLEYSSDILNHIVFSGIPYNGEIKHSLTVPSYYSQLYIRRKEGGKFSSQIIDIANNKANYIHTVASKASKTGKAGVDDFLFCVNGSAELFQVDPLDGTLTYLSDMPNGSFTCAIDQENGYLYSIGKGNPYPLNRYDIANNTWTSMGNVGRGGPRLDYSSDDGLLYFSTGAKVYTIDPNNANTLSTWDIEGLDSTAGGDLAFAEDGVLFLCTFSGLYRLDLDNNNVYQSTRISGEGLPFSPTSMTFDSNNELWLANNGSSSNLIVMDTQTGGWEYRYGPNSNSGIDFGRTINDLTTYRIFDENMVDQDSDGDGIMDSDDEFPDDAEKAFEQFTPSKYGWGTVAFEDLWPYLGDYDFNDTAVNYRFVAVLNAQNEAVQLDIHYEVTSDGANFVNGFGLEFENIAPGEVTAVTGTSITENYINVASNGVEEGQDNAVVILFDNHERQLNVPHTVSVTFNTPIPTAQLGNAPFNPFLIIDMDRTREIHLPNSPRTTLGINDTTVEGVNRDEDGNFATDIGLPWAINIIHNFRVPKERVPVNRAYNHFNEWVTSGGVNFSDWYKDSNGYRNESDLKVQ